MAALVAVNALGDVVDPDDGKLLAGARTEDGKGLADTLQQIREGIAVASPSPGENTTLGVVAANVGWTKAQAAKVAQMAHDGLALAIRPAHMPFDGDTIFALGTGGQEVDANLLGRIGALAANLTAQAVVAAVLRAEGIEGLPTSGDIAGADDECDG